MGIIIPTITKNKFIDIIYGQNYQGFLHHQ